MNQPPSDQTAGGPAYQGRLLPRPADEVVDQGLDFDIRTLLSRRRMLQALGLGAGMVALAACGVDAATTADTTTSSSAGRTEIPDETAGPYPGDGSNGPDVLEESGIVRSDIRSSFGTSTTRAEGVPLTFELTVLDLAEDAAPFVGVAVYVWQCDREGRYSMYSEGVENENYLRGVQVTDSDGKVRFTSIVPACYSGRWPHIHVEVYPDEASITDATTTIATSQLALPQEMVDTVYATTGYAASVANLGQITLDSDNVFGDDGAEHQLAAVTGDVASGYVATLTVPVDTAAEPTGGGAPGGGGGGGAPDGPRPSRAPSASATPG